MALESTKDFIRKEIRDNLEGFAMDHLDLQTEKEIHDFIESQKDTIEKALENCLDEESFRMAEEEGFESIDEFIECMPGDFFRECMCGVGIPGWDNN
jgi:hypothetical protein